MNRKHLSCEAGSAPDTPEIPACDYRAENPFMNLAIAEARTGIHLGHGGPFGAVVVRDGTVIGSGHNMVLVAHDSTCHGEIAAIRNAEQHLGTHDLSGCELYTTGEPCPMCLAAIMWANIGRVYYGATIHDNAGSAGSGGLSQAFRGIPESPENPVLTNSGSRTQQLCVKFNAQFQRRKQL